MDSQNACAVCYEEYSANELFILSCHHRFDSRCLKYILESNNKCCPLCRKDFNYNTIVAIKTYNSIIQDDISIFNNITYMLDIMPKLNLRESSMFLNYLMNFTYEYVDIGFEKLYIYEFKFCKYKIVSYIENEKKIKYKIHFMVSIEIIATDTNNALILFKRQVPKPYRKFITDDEFINRVNVKDFSDYDLVNHGNNTRKSKVNDYFSVTLDEKTDKLTVHCSSNMHYFDLTTRIMASGSAIHISNRKNHKYFTVDDNLNPISPNDKVYTGNQVNIKEIY